MLKQTDCFFGLLNIETNKLESKKYFELKEFIHPDDEDLFSYHFLSQTKSDDITFNFRIINQDGAIVILTTELEKVSCDSINKTIVLKAKLHDSKSLLTNSILEKASKINFNSMLRLSGDFIFFKDIHHIYTASSQTMANITGFSCGNEHIGLTDYDIFPKEHADNYYRLEKEIYHGKKISVEDVQPFSDENGVEGWVSNHKYSIKDESGVIIGLFGIARIITEEILTKRKLKEVQAQSEQLANTDDLTSLSNRRHGYILCKRLIKEASRFEQTLLWMVLKTRLILANFAFHNHRLWRTSPFFPSLSDYFFTSTVPFHLARHRRLTKLKSY